jgi:hypothetical protein
LSTNDCAPRPRIRNFFVQHAQNWWKLWSSWLAVLWGVIVTIFWNDPSVLKEIADAVPDQYRIYLSPVVMAVVTGLPILVRLLKQNAKKTP